MKTAVRICSLAVFGFLLVNRFSGLNALAVWTVLQRMSWGAILPLVPAMISTLSDTFGWAACVLRKPTVSLLLPLLPLRLGCDALLNSVPAGVAVAETARPLLLQRRCGGMLPDAIAACLLAKINMAIAQTLFIILVIALSIGAGHTLLMQEAGSRARELAFAGMVLIPMLAGLALVYTGPRLTQMANLLGRVRWGSLRRLLVRVSPGLQTIDTYVRAFGRQHPVRLVQSLAAFIAGWLLVGLESWVILALLGAGIPVWQALFLEATASLLRIAFFFIPSALGATEFAYASLIAAFGVADPVVVAAGFIVVKRSREFIWIVLGYSTFFLPKIRSSATHEWSPFAFAKTKQIT